MYHFILNGIVDHPDDLNELLFELSNKKLEELISGNKDKRKILK